MMKLTGLHLLLTYQCNYECDHCFVWGSPWQTGTMTLENIRHILEQAKTMDTIGSIYFEGGEPFLYYPILLRGAREAAYAGFKVGIVTNSYWALGTEDAMEWLQPFAHIADHLQISSDLYHADEKLSKLMETACAAADQVGISRGILSVAQPDATTGTSSVGQLPEGESCVMYRGRAADKLAPKVPTKNWEEFTKCPHEELREPGRLHVDPLGFLHICQGITVGNLYEDSLREICEMFDPEHHPIVGPLLEGGPAELARRYDVAHKDEYADACQLCYETCRALRERFPEILGPDQMYGIPEADEPA
jgi:MoaA/NifB/PqqE/SkfB family radical SAM enzyme